MKGLVGGPLLVGGLGPGPLGPLKSGPASRQDSVSTTQGCYSHCTHCNETAAVAIHIAIKGRPNFGFGFGAERLRFNIFGTLSVSAQSSHDTFDKILVSAAMTSNLGLHHRHIRISDTVSRCSTIDRRCSPAAELLLSGLSILGVNYSSEP